MAVVQAGTSLWRPAVKGEDVEFTRAVLPEGGHLAEAVQAVCDGDGICGAAVFEAKRHQGSGAEV